MMRFARMSNTVLSSLARSFVSTVLRDVYMSGCHTQTETTPHRYRQQRHTTAQPFGQLAGVQLCHMRYAGAALVVQQACSGGAHSIELCQLQQLLPHPLQQS